MSGPRCILELVREPDTITCPYLTSSTADWYTGGNLQDLVVRTACAALGAIWAGFAFAAGHGNPYVLAAFAAMFMIPMLYRFTQSNHPRSGLVGCLSFSVISLIAYRDEHRTAIVKIAWTRGLAFVVGVAAALVINWVFWPFVARHELRKSISAMLLHSAILYRAVISKYVYYKEGEPPGPEEIVNSEMLEGRLREVFVRIRQLLEMTRHELVSSPNHVAVPTRLPFSLTSHL